MKQSHQRSFSQFALLFAAGVFADSATAALPISSPALRCAQSLKEAVQSIPDLLTEGTLDERVESCRSWIAGLRALKGVDGVRIYPALQFNFLAWIALNVELASRERLNDASELCEALFDALEDRQTRKQRVAYNWSVNELERGNFAEVDRILDEHLRLQGVNPGRAWERAFYFVGRANLAAKRGLFDRAYEYKVAAEPAWELAASKHGEVRLREVRAALDRVSIEILLGQGDWEQALAAAREKVASISDDLQQIESPSEDDLRYLHQWTRPFKAQEALALSLLARRRGESAAEAVAALRQIADDPNSRVAEQFEASLQLWEIFLSDGKLDLAQEEGRRASELSETVLQIAMVRSSELLQAISLGESEASHTEAFTRWRAAFDATMSLWLNDPPRAAGSGIMALGERRAILRAGLESFRERGDLEGAFNLYLETERIGSLSRLLREGQPDRQTLTATAVREELLSPGEVLLVPLLFNRRSSLLFILTADSLECLPIDTSGAAFDLIRQLKQRVARPPEPGSDATKRRATIRSEGQQLRELLLPDAALKKCLAASVVSVVDVHVHGRLPMDLIDVDGRLLCELVPMMELASLDVRASLDARSVHDHAMALSVVTNVPAPELAADSKVTGLAPLVLDDAATRRLHPKGERVTELLTGAAGTEERVLGSVLTGATMVTFVAHGYADYSRERPATLWLGGEGPGDGLLSADEIEGLEGIADVVFLAACGAASGADRVGDAGAGHLGGAFTMGGARAVILASGDLPVEATILATERTHHHLLGGASVAGAVHLARLDVASDPRFEDPSAYAQLRVYGLGSHVPFPAAAAAAAVPPTDGNSGRGSRQLWWLYLLAAGVIVFVLIKRRS